MGQFLVCLGIRVVREITEEIAIREISQEMRVLRPRGRSFTRTPKGGTYIGPCVGDYRDDPRETAPSMDLMPVSRRNYMIS